MRRPGKIFVIWLWWNTFRWFLADAVMLPVLTKICWWSAKLSANPIQGIVVKCSNGFGPSFIRWLWFCLKLDQPLPNLKSLTKIKQKWQNMACLCHYLLIAHGIMLHVTLAEEMEWSSSCHCRNCHSLCLSVLLSKCKSRCHFFCQIMMIRLHYMLCNCDNYHLTTLSWSWKCHHQVSGCVLEQLFVENF